MNKGRSTTTKPIPLEVINKIKQLIQNQPRELCYLTVMCNTAMRTGDMLNLQLDDIHEVDGHLELCWIEKKTGKYRQIPLNTAAAQALRDWLKVRPVGGSYVFVGQRGKMNSCWWSQLIKKWCIEVGYEEPRTSNHSLRKTFCRVQYEQHKVPLYVLSEALNHSSERNTRMYMGLTSESLTKMYANVV